MGGAILLRNVCVGDDGRMCQRENGVRAVLSLSFFTLRVYEVTKKAFMFGYARLYKNMQKRMPDTIVETTYSLFVCFYTTLRYSNL